MNLKTWPKTREKILVHRNNSRDDTDVEIRRLKTIFKIIMTMLKDKGKDGHAKRTVKGPQKKNRNYFLKNKQMQILQLKNVSREKFTWVQMENIKREKKKKISELEGKSIKTIQTNIERSNEQSVSDV